MTTQTHANYSSQINLESPIGKMPFGKYKGELIWTLPINQVAWMKANMNLSDRSIKTLDDGWEMFLKEGQFAVLRKFKDEKWHVQLQGIYESKNIADTHTNVGPGFEDFVYHIVKPQL